MTMNHRLAMLAILAAAASQAHWRDGMAYTSEVVVGPRLGQTSASYQGVVSLKVVGSYSVAGTTYFEALGETYDATLYCPSPIAPTDGATFAARGMAVATETRFAFSVPAFGRTDPLSATWSCGLVVEIRAADGEVVQQNDLVVRIVYVAGGGAGAIPVDAPGQ